MKLLALYLPQYHQVKENDEWWGNGYTEWTAVKNAKPLFKGHDEPRVPLNDNYYDLSDNNAIAWKWQAELAEKYGVYGFCIYHYWFGNGKQLLEKPIEILLKHPEINLKYCICWANESWTRTWYGVESEILCEQKYGTADEWEKHFMYLLQFFKDPRYIKIDNKPMVNIYHTYEIGNLKEMRLMWDRLAREHGFSGIYLVSANTGSILDVREDINDAYYNMEPSYSLKHCFSKKDTFKYLFRTFAVSQINKYLKKQYVERKIDIRLVYRNSDKTDNEKIFPGITPMWDNTPRRSYKGLVYTHATPYNFECQLRKINRLVSNRKYDFVYINAWNEWGEGAYLEPDNSNKYAYLEAIKKVIGEKENEQK